MRYSSVCESIEAEKIEIRCRKFVPQQPRMDPKLGKVIYPFKLNIHGFARISEVYPSSKKSYKEKSYRGADDEIHGETLDGFSLKPAGKTRVKRGSGSHKAQFVQCRGGSYVHVEIGVREQLAKNK